MAFFTRMVVAASSKNELPPGEVAQPARPSSAAAMASAKRCLSLIISLSLVRAQRARNTALRHVQPRKNCTPGARPPVRSRWLSRPRNAKLPRYLGWGQTPILDFSWLGSDPDFWSGSDPDFSRTQQAAGEKRLEVAPAVGDQIDVDPLSFDAVENAIRLEEGLAVRANPERKQLPWMRAPVRKPCERRDGSQDLILHVRGPARRIVDGDPIVDLLEVGERVRRQPDREAHQRPARRARSLRVASASAIALPSSICRLPRARIFSNASVSCVAS